ncbi:MULTISPECIES: hypothetical protein [unclassified Roseovarius]|jgi:hypothetical protein|uniref:hypothetical protein n=1 Tax=unclassified Roseovarius TaxID=2614913 RepID=UPI0000685DD4|nr:MULTISPECIES: hypothetical protein [unclassified Roseovarius]EAQ26465.1 hypothetical protein ROS217_14851 [Roseovarius sp. 217]KJS40132.1 MAG: hypothetical protein VR71_23985 [Roseovarius sp. BRH_c41]
MMETPKSPDPAKPAFAEAEIVSVLRNLSNARVRLVAEFIAQIAMVHDPDVVKTFLAWRSDPRLDTLLLLASELDVDALDQLLFKAEDLSAQTHDMMPGK